MGCGSSHHVSEGAIMPNHGNFISQQARKRKQKSAHGNLLNLIESATDVSKTVRQLAQNQSAAFEDLFLFARDTRDHDGDNTALIAVTDTMHSLNEDGAEASRALVASQNAFVHTSERILLCYKQVEAREKALKDANSKQAHAESALDSAKQKELKARGTDKYEKNKAKLLNNVTQYENQLVVTKSAAETATTELEKQRVQMKVDKEQLVKQMLYSINVAYDKSNRTQLEHLAKARAAILTLPGPNEDQLLAQADVDNEPARPTSKAAAVQDKEADAEAA